MTTTRREFLAAVAATGLAIPTRRSLSAPPDDGVFADVNRDIALNHIGPRHDAFADAARKLTGVVSSFADGDADLSAARAALHDAMDAWMGVQHVRLGPSQAEARAFRVQFWPDTRNRVGRQLGSVLAEERADLVDDPEAMANASVALQGLPALERLLYEIEPAPGSYAARFARAIAANLDTVAAELSAAWAPGGGWSEGLYTPGGGAKAYPTAARATSALVLATTTQIEFVVDKKLRAPLGADADDPRPRLAESWRGGRSLRNVRFNVAALVDLYENGGGRLRRLIENADDGGLAGAVSSDLHSALDAIAALPDGFGDGLAEARFRDRVTSAADSLDRARVLLSRDAAPALGLLLGFNSLDGD